MSVVDEYISRAYEALRSASSIEIDNVAREIVSAFQSEIPNILHYRGGRINSGPSRHTAADLKKLIGKLRVLQEAKDRELYGEFGLSAMSEHIRRLENAMNENGEGDPLADACRDIDYIYANTYEGYTDGLAGYGSHGVEGSFQQCRLRIEKLKSYRDAELRKIKTASAPALNMNQYQYSNASACASVEISLDKAFESIDSLPQESLSRAEKSELKELLRDLANGNKEESEGRLKRIQRWLADKGTDALIAAMPYVLQFAQTNFGC
jgi:hypothetical protein